MWLPFLIFGALIRNLFLEIRSSELPFTADDQVGDGGIVGVFVNASRSESPHGGLAEGCSIILLLDEKERRV